MLDLGEGGRAGIVPGKSGAPFRACQERVEGFEDGGTVGNESMIKINQAQKLAKLVVSGRLREVLYGLDLPCQWLDALAGDVVAKKIQS